MFTREQMLDAYHGTDEEVVAVHRRYYAQLVAISPGVLTAIERAIGLPRLRSSRREAFNDISLQEWDNAGQ